MGSSIKPSRSALTLASVAAELEAFGGDTLVYGLRLRMQRSSEVPARAGRRGWTRAAVESRTRLAVVIWILETETDRGGLRAWTGSLCTETNHRFFFVLSTD